jgi:hypothetical protein
MVILRSEISGSIMSIYASIWILTFEGPGVLFESIERRPEPLVKG